MKQGRPLIRHDKGDEPIRRNLTNTTNCCNHKRLKQRRKKKGRQDTKVKQCLKKRFQRNKHNTINKNVLDIAFDVSLVEDINITSINVRDTSVLQ